MVLICARGGSKGIPFKNIRDLGGQPLIAWSIETANRCRFIDRIVVSTDSERIADVARYFGADVPFMRPATLAGDNSPEWPVWQHALREIEKSDYFEPDYLIVLPPTSPFRSVTNIKKGIEQFYEGDTDIVISIRESGRNPYFNMVELNPEGFAQLCKQSDKMITRRQNAPRVFDMTTVLYVSSREFILNSKGAFDGRVKAITIPDIRAMDIDTEMDLKFSEFLISEKMITSNEKNI